VTMPPPLATARVRSDPAAGGAGLVVGGGHLEVGPGAASPLDLLTASVAACGAQAARSYLDRQGDRGAFEVVASLDAGPPPVIYRRVVLEFRLGAADARALVDALGRAQVSTMLRPAFTVRTQVEFDGEALA
jgi:uncharacterized OsmC-like protein